MPCASRTINRKQLTGNKSFKFQVSSFKFSFGFTLVEFLVVLGLLAMTIGSTLLFLTSILKGSNQANIVAETKQNGQAVLDSLERQIRNGVDAKKIAVNTIKIIREGQDPLYIKCIPSSPPTSNGSIGAVVATSDPADTDYTSASLTNRDDTVSGVDISCNQNSPFSFDVIPPSSGDASPSIVFISFVVNQGIGAPSRQDFLANVQFQTRISLRKY